MRSKKIRIISKILSCDLGPKCILTTICRQNSLIALRCALGSTSLASSLSIVFSRSRESFSDISGQTPRDSRFSFPPISVF